MKSSKIFVSGLFAFALIASSFSMSVSSVLAETEDDDSDNSPELVEAKAFNTGGTSAKEAGDSIILKFSEETNKFEITEENIENELEIISGNSFLDGADALRDISWSDDGKKLIIILSDATSLPTVKVGDKVMVVGSSIKNLDGDPVSGYAYIEGDFGTKLEDDEGDEDEGEGDDKEFKCGNSLINGRLYMVGTDATVYMSAACYLKPFRGAAVFKARGLKFENIIILSELPKEVKISDKPVLPAEGTLVKGKKDRTVWFVEKSGKRRGFTSAEVFTKLGFKFEQVQEIEDTDLGLMDTDTNIADDSKHPDGALVKCGASPQVFAVIDGVRFPFANADVFMQRGHAFEHILNVDCGRFAYKQGAAIK